MSSSAWQRVRTCTCTKRRDCGVPSRGRYRTGAQRACRARSKAFGGIQVAAVGVRAAQEGRVRPSQRAESLMDEGQ